MSFGQTSTCTYDNSLRDELLCRILASAVAPESLTTLSCNLIAHRGSDWAGECLQRWSGCYTCVAAMPYDTVNVGVCGGCCVGVITMVWWLFGGGGCYVGMDAMVVRGVIVQGCGCYSMVLSKGWSLRTGVLHNTATHAFTLWIFSQQVTQYAKSNVVRWESSVKCPLKQRSSHQWRNSKIHTLRTTRELKCSSTTT